MRRHPHPSTAVSDDGAAIPPHDRALLLALFGAVSSGEYRVGSRITLQSPHGALMLVVCRGASGRWAVRFEPPEAAA